MKMKPIYFPAPVADDMVRAILDGRKTVTRRVVKPCYRADETGFRVVKNRHTGEYIRLEYIDEHETVTRWFHEPYTIGEILYVQETWAAWSRTEGTTPTLHYKADGNVLPGVKWHPSIHMPREAARIFLRVTEAREQKDITYGKTIDY